MNDHTENTKEESRVTLEECFTEIEEIIDKMEEEDIPLHESFELYQSGLKQIKAASSMLDAMEKAMLVLNEQGELGEF